MSKAFTSIVRIRFVLCFMAFAFCVLYARLFYLHIIDSDRLQEFAETTRKKVQVLPSKRGNIFDSKGNILAATHSTYIIGVDPNFLKEEERTKWSHLAFILQIPYNELVAIMEKKVRTHNGRLIRWASLSKNADLGVYKAVEQLKIRGVYGNRKNKRIYPGNSLASHIIGFVNHESQAVSGVEQLCDYYLKGQDGWFESEKDGRRRELAHARSREIQPVNGHDVFLTLDQRLQSAVEFEIQSVVEKYNPKGVTVIISRPEDGSILALANYPTFDLNRFYDTKLYPISNQRNLAITDMLEPGSTFKIVSASAVLNEGLVELTDTFSTGNAKVNYRNRILTLPKDTHHYDELSMEQIVIKSSNRGAAHLGLVLGEDRLHDYASDFGFGQLTDFGFRGEISGTLHPVNKWDRLTITRMPMGHAVGATPMQIHFATSVIANKGILMKPRIIERIADDQGDSLIEYEPVAKKRVISEAVAEQMALLLGDVVKKQGTARRAAIKGYAVGGKTGTTQKIVKGQYSHSKHVASFSGFLPIHAPEVVITVIIDEPNLKSQIAYGGRVAAPVFKNIAEACIQYLEIRPIEYSRDWVASGKN